MTSRHYSVMLAIVFSSQHTDSKYLLWQKQSTTTHKAIGQFHGDDGLLSNFTTPLKLPKLHTDSVQ